MCGFTHGTVLLGHLDEISLHNTTDVLGLREKWQSLESTAEISIHVTRQFMRESFDEKVSFVSFRVSCYIPK